MEIDESLKEVLSKNNCPTPKNLYVSDIGAVSSERLLEDDPSVTYVRRGDIPIFTDCDEGKTRPLPDTIRMFMTNSFQAS